MIGDRVKFECNTVGYPLPKIKWLESPCKQLDSSNNCWASSPDVDIKNVRTNWTPISSDKYSTVEENNGQKATSTYVTTVQESNSKYIRCKATNSYNVTELLPGLLSFKVKPKDPETYSTKLILATGTVSQRKLIYYTVNDCMR